MAGQLFIISAASGTGKSTLINELRKRVKDLGYSISHTSRSPRGTENDGVDYYFVDQSAFIKMTEEGAFVEWAKVYGSFYGTSFSSLDKQTSSGLDVLLDIDTQGARNIKKHFESSVLIYMLPPSLEVLEKRLKDRGTDEEQVIKTRMQKALEDIKNCVWYDYVIINDDLEKAVEDVQAVIISERLRTARRLLHVKTIFGNSLAL